MPNRLPPPAMGIEAKGLGPCVYIATSSGLHNWARANDTSYLFKVGYTEQLHVRSDTLNGRGWRSHRIHSTPCMGFTDWRLVPCMDFVHLHWARKVEGQVKNGLWRILERFDPKPLIGDSRPSNGESEIFRIRPDRIPDAVAYAGTAITNTFNKPKVQAAMEVLVHEIARYETERSSIK